MTSSKYVSLSLAIIVASFFVCLPADAQPLSIGKPNSVVVKLDVKDTSKCNIEVSTPWQDKFEVEVTPPSMEAQFEVTPREPGLLVLTWTGKTKFRGLKSVTACTGSGEVRLIAGYTSETAKPLWDKLFSTLSSEQAECVRIGLDSAKLKYSAIDPRTEVIDPTDSKAKSVFARCESFFKIKQGFIDKGTWSETQLTSCTVGGVRTMCEGAYGIPLADGKFMPLSRIDAMRYHHENRPWTLYRREPQSLRDARLAQAEQARLEEERQREAKRLADEKAAADRAKQAEEERQREAKRIADARAAIEKTENQKSQGKKNVAKDILGGGANQSALDYVRDKKWSEKNLPCDFNGGVYQIFSGRFPSGYAFFVKHKAMPSDAPERHVFRSVDDKKFILEQTIGANSFVTGQLGNPNVIAAEIVVTITLTSPKRIDYEKKFKKLNFDALMRNQLLYEFTEEKGFGLLCN